MQLNQTPLPESQLLYHAGDILEITLQTDTLMPGQAFVRSNLNRSTIRRNEIIAATEKSAPIQASDWHDIPMQCFAPGNYIAKIPLTEVGWFSAKTFFVPSNSETIMWPEGGNFTVKVEPAQSCCANSIYTAFIRQFGKSLKESPWSAEIKKKEEELDKLGYAVIPPSGTFRDFIKHLDEIINRMGFRIIQLLPIHPTPTTYGRMGRYGSPFAARDLMDVDPALAEFDRSATPLEQFCELVDAVHQRGARIFLDIPANHTGWASTLQIHHPEWFKRNSGTFDSPGAWGITWEDLVELDFSHTELHTFIANVFLFWCEQGVDGFRCDAGYMIPAEVWRYVVAKVRESFPDTIFLLEGLGGKIETTARLITETNLNWAYSEIFQNYDRSALEYYLRDAIQLSESYGPLIHFAETHDNNRLANNGEVYARMRTALAALFSHQGAFGISNGVEWFATEKIYVHEANNLNWGATANQVDLIATLNAILQIHPAFDADAKVRLLEKAKGGNVLAAVRKYAKGRKKILVLVNLDTDKNQSIEWRPSDFDPQNIYDLITGNHLIWQREEPFVLSPGQFLCLTGDREELDLIATGSQNKSDTFEPAAIARQQRNLLALRVNKWLHSESEVFDGNPDELGELLTKDIRKFCTTADGLPRLTVWRWPVDSRRIVMVPPDFLLNIVADHPFKAKLKYNGRTVECVKSIVFEDNTHGALIRLSDHITEKLTQAHQSFTLQISVYNPDTTEHGTTNLLALSPYDATKISFSATGEQIRAEPDLCGLLTNNRGAYALVRADWGLIRSQYDALLSLNNDPSVPVDRTIFLTRIRAWLRYRGYSHAINANSTELFEVDSKGQWMRWYFDLPCGMGQRVKIAFTLAMVPHRNKISLTCERFAGSAKDLPDGEPVTIVLRPDIEWRSFHEKTKAYLGLEPFFNNAIESKPDGFVFRPTNTDECCVICQQGQYNPNPEWLYLIQHPIEMERGLEGNSDLFSPGWFSVTLKGNGRSILTAYRADSWAKNDGTPEIDKIKKLPELNMHRSLPFKNALDNDLNAFIVKRDNLQTIIAGYPWFLDWGRDTLIALRGLIASGRCDQALMILREFGRMENNGTLPNMIRGNDDSNRSTSDAPLWLSVAACDLMDAIGPQTVLEAQCGNRTLREVLISIATNYSGVMSNGIHMDKESGLIYSPPHFTWMDTNHPAATPRAGYPIEIQALWIASLELLGKHVDKSWKQLAAKARKSLHQLFWTHDPANPQIDWLADCLRAEPHTPASKALQEDAVRPNQLLAVTLGAVTDRAQCQSIIEVCERLLVPGAIRSLADQPVRTELPVWHDGQLLNNPVKPFWGNYLGDENTRRKPAYHNGTAWTWMFPLYAEAYLMCYGSSARATALAWLSSASVLGNHGCLGQIPEIVDGFAPHTQRGCCAQAWGVSELLRVWLKAEIM